MGLLDDMGAALVETNRRRLPRDRHRLATPAARSTRSEDARTAPKAYSSRKVFGVFPFDH
jgi:hypothetical protein